MYAGEPEGEAPRPAAAPAGAPPVVTAGTVYTVDFGENDQRQMTVADLVAAYNGGQVTGDTYLWADGFADWTPLAQTEEVVAALNAAATVDETSAAGASTAPHESPWADNAANRAQATPAPAPVAARGADLFGGIRQAGAEAEIATSASSGSSAIGSASPAFGASAPAGTGARNESSVLFSLSALTAAAGTSRPNNLAPIVPTQHVTEDSGLIDLKALTAAAEHRPLAAAPVAAAPLGFGGGLPLGGAPLGSPYGGPLDSLAPAAAAQEQHDPLHRHLRGHRGPRRGSHLPIDGEGSSSPATAHSDGSAHRCSAASPALHADFGRASDGGSQSSVDG